MERKQHATLLRFARKIHRTLGASLFALFLVISITGLLLGWKKNSNGYLLAKTQQGSSSKLQECLPIDSLYFFASKALIDSIDHQISIEVARIDFRPEKGIAKFIFKKHFWAVQIDCANGHVMKIERRRADIIESIHDGSFIDNQLGVKSGTFKLIFTSVSGLALLFFTITGFWLWYGPKRMRKS